MRDPPGGSRDPTGDPPQGVRGPPPGSGGTPQTPGEFLGAFPDLWGSARDLPDPSGGVPGAAEFSENSVCELAGHVVANAI